MTGASFTFGGGILYMWLNTYLSFKMVGCGINSKALSAFRFFASFTSLVTFVICVTARYISIEEWNSGKHYSSTKELWHPKDSGYDMHVVSSISEWITAMLFLLFFLSFHNEFDQISFEFRVKRTTYAALPFEVSVDGRNTPLLA